MNWTKEMPKRGCNGYYWTRRVNIEEYEAPETPLIVRLTFDGEIENAFVNIPGFAGYTSLLEFAKETNEGFPGELPETWVTEWAGPIAQPLDL